MSQGRATSLPGTEHWQVSFSKRQQNEEAISQRYSCCACACFPNASHFSQPETLFPVSVFVSKMQLCLRYTAGNFNEKPSMQAMAKNLRAWAASTHLIFANNSSKGQLLRALSNLMGPFDTLLWKDILPVRKHVIMIAITQRTDSTPS